MQSGLPWQTSITTSPCCLCLCPPAHGLPTCPSCQPLTTSNPLYTQHTHSTQVSTFTCRDAHTPTHTHTSQRQLPIHFRLQPHATWPLKQWRQLRFHFITYTFTLLFPLLSLAPLVSAVIFIQQTKVTHYNMMLFSHAHLPSQPLTYTIYTFSYHHVYIPFPLFKICLLNILTLPWFITERNKG